MELEESLKGWPLSMATLNKPGCCYNLDTEERVFSGLEIKSILLPKEWERV